MNKILYFWLIIIFSAINIFAQKNLTLEQVILEPQSISPQRLIQLNWIPDTDDFAYVKENKIISENAEIEGEQTLLTLEQLNEALLNSGIEKVNRFPGFKWLSKNEISFWSGSKLLSYDIVNAKLTILNSLKEGAENIDFINTDKIAYTIENNLYISVKSKQLQITNEEKGIVSGQIVSRNEYGIDKGTFWSLNSNYLAFYQKDEREVTDYPLINIETKPASVKYIKYPMAGMTSEKVKVGVYDLNTGEIIWLKTGEPNDKYLPGVTWSPDEKYIYIAELNRDTDTLRLTRYDASTGDFLKVIIEETSDKYVEPMNGPIFFRNEPDIFLWLTRNDGWNHLYLYDAQGNMIKKLTDGQWEVTDFDGFSGYGINIFFTATEQSPIERHYYKLDLDRYEMTRLTNGKGIHHVIKNSDGSKFLDEFNNIDIPYKVTVLDRNGENVRDVYSAQNPLSDYNIGKTKIFTLKSEDGYDLYCREILPPDFDSTKQYPVIVYVYGGPHVQLITNSWLAGAKLWFHYMAENGYILFTLDNRGSSSRGLEFEQKTYRKLGTVEINDQILGVNYLKSLSYVDSTRLGIQGWSFGGYMTTGLMTRTPGVFKVGIAGGAVIDWRYYEVMYTERYMDTPEQNPDGYEETSLLNYVLNLKGKLLLVHGTYDQTVVWQHTLLFIEKAMHLGIDVDYFPYVGHEHGIRGNDTYHLYLKMTNYFLENL